MGFVFILCMPSGLAPYRNQVGLSLEFSTPRRNWTEWADLRVGIFLKTA